MGGHGYFLGMFCDTERADLYKGVVVGLWWGCGGVVMWGSQLPTLSVFVEVTLWPRLVH